MVRCHAEPAFCFLAGGSSSSRLRTSPGLTGMCWQIHRATAGAGVITWRTASATALLQSSCQRALPRSTHVGTMSLHSSDGTRQVPAL